MTRTSTAASVSADRCPGALSLHEAQDGLLARVRVPGGRLTASRLLGLADVAEVHAGAVIELTSRANVQLRGVHAEAVDAFAAAIAELGLLPSATHERVRNIVATPLAGVDREDVGVDALVGELDARLCRTARLARLSGRFLFGIDDGRGDIVGLQPDAWAAHVGDDRWWVGPTAVVVGAGEVVGELLSVADEMVTWHSDVWRVADLPDGGQSLVARTRSGRGEMSPPSFSATQPPTGVVRRPDGTNSVVAHVPLGRLTPQAARTVASAAATGLRITPWRSVVVPDAADVDAVLAGLTGAGLVVGLSLWVGVSSCTGRPGCAMALADVRSDAAAAVSSGRVTPHGVTTLPVHWSGCERRCGSPATPHVQVVATGAGYDVRSPS